MRAQLEARLAALQKEFETGERRLQELELQQAQLRDTLLRISGAIQVLKEELGDGDQPGAADAGSVGDERQSG